MKAVAVIGLFLASIWGAAQTNPLDPGRADLPWNPLPFPSENLVLDQTERMASLYLRQLLIEKAGEYGVTVNNVSGRRSKSLGSGQWVIRAYMGYDTELLPLTDLLRDLAGNEIGIWVETLNIAVRRKRSASSEHPITRPSINGNLVVACVTDDGGIEPPPSGEAPDAESEAPIIGEPLLALKAFDGLVHHLPEAAWITSLQIKRHRLLRIQGETERPEEILRFFEAHPGFEDAHPLIRTKGQRFAYGATLALD